MLRDPAALEVPYPLRDESYTPHTQIPPSLITSLSLRDIANIAATDQITDNDVYGVMDRWTKLQHNVGH